MNGGIDMLLIKNANIKTMADKDYNIGSILVKDGKILEIGENIRIESSKVKVIDATGCIVMPGMIDAHCHIGIYEEDKGFEGLDINEMTDPTTPNLRAIDAINPFDTAFKEAVEAGITTVLTGPGSANVIGGQFVAMKTYGKCIDDMVIKDPIALKVAFGENPKKVYNSKNRMPITRMAIAGLLRENLVKAQNYKVQKEEALKEGKSFNIDLKMEPLVLVLEKKIPLKAHCHRADDILTAIRIGKEFDLNVTLDHCTEGYLVKDYINKSGYPAIVGPGLCSRSKIELANRTEKNAGELNKEGIDVAIITDHPVTPIQYLPLCAIIAVKEGMDKNEALKSITINAAKISGIEKRVGSIEVGKDADIIILDGDPLNALSNVLYTIIDGEVVYKR